MTVAIHQPNFFPWLGFFQKILEADTFIYLEHTLHNPRNPLWTKRVQMLLNGKPNWLTVPLRSSKEQIFLPLNGTYIQTLPKWDVKLKRSIEQNYSKAPFFADMMSLVVNFFENPSDLIVDRNIGFIEQVCIGLKISDKRVKSSEFGFETSSNELLIDLVKAVNGTEYLAGDGADGYQDVDLFSAAGIGFRNLGFQHPKYRQFNTDTFVKGLSILDPIANLGFEGTRELLVNNRAKVASSDNRHRKDHQDH